MRQWLLVASGSAVALAALGVLLLFRYQPMVNQTQPGPYDMQPGQYFLLVWDRLGHRECWTPRPEVTNVTGMACSRREIEALAAKIDRAVQVSERQSPSPTAADARSASAVTEPGAVQQMAPGAALIAKLKAAVNEDGKTAFTDKEINGFVIDRSNKMRGIGFTPEQVEAYWGTAP